VNYSENKFSKIPYLILIIYILLLKIYFLLIQPLNLQANIVAVNTEIFFNAKSFAHSPQSFHDWNRLGTPVYYLTNLIFYFKKYTTSEIYDFLNLFHIFTFIFLCISIFIFIDYFRKFLNVKSIFTFLIIFISFDTFLLSLEVVDFTNFKISLTLLILIYFHKYLYTSNTKNLCITIFIIQLSNSITLAFLSLTVPVAISLIFIQLKKKLFKQLILNLILNFFFLALLNLPILGRIPKIIYSVLFTRDDTSFNVFEILNLLNKFLILIYDHNYFFFFIIILILILFLFNFFIILKNSKIKFEKQVLYILANLILFFFFYTILSSSNVNFGVDIYTVRGTALRNIFITCSFIFIVFLTHDLKLKNLIFLGSIILMLISHLNYIKDRTNLKEISKIKEMYLKNEINRLNVNKNKIIFYSDYTYGIQDFSIISIGNSIFAGEKFTDEIFMNYPQLRFLRLIDLLFIIRKNKLNENKYLYLIDYYIKKYAPEKLYLYLTPLSHKITSNWIGDQKRSKEIFIKKDPNETADIIIFNNSHLIGNDFDLLKTYIQNETNLKNYIKKNIFGDVWHFFF